MNFSISKMKEVIKSTTPKRVSKSAAEELDDELQEYGGDVASKALEVANEKGRKTVRAEDIRDAMKQKKRAGK